MRIIAIMLALVAVLSRPSSPKALAPIQDAQEVWKLTLPEAIRIGLENQEPVRCIMIGATQIPLGGFEPVAATGADGERTPAGPLDSVYDDEVLAGAPKPDGE